MSNEQTTTLPVLPTGIDWAVWLQRWDEQQAGYLPNREFRFTAMLDVLEALLPDVFTVLDLCCGPGSISQRVLARFPQAHCIAADLDPVLIALGQAVLGNSDGRLRWVTVDLTTDTNLADTLGVEHVDAVLSTTALHWLPTENLVQVYQQLGELVRPGGVFMNGDHIKFAPHLSAFQEVAKSTRKRQEKAAFEEQGGEDWKHWWDELAAIPGTEPLFAERERRFSWRTPDFAEAILDIHKAALRFAGFPQVDTIWQYMDNWIVMAVR